MPIGTAKWLVEQHTDGTHAVRYVTGNCYRLFQSQDSLFNTKNLPNEVWMLQFRIAEMHVKDKKNIGKTDFYMFFEA